MTQTLNFAGQYHTKGKFIATVEMRGGVPVGTVDGHTVVWGKDGNCRGHPAYNLTGRVIEKEATRA